MKSTIFANFSSLATKLAIALPLALVICAPSVFAQSFDVTTLPAGTSAAATGLGGQAMDSLGASGNYGVTSYKTGEAPNSAGLSGIKNGVTTKQQSGPNAFGFNSPLLLNPAGYGGLAPIFGGGGYGYTPPTNILNLNLFGGAVNAGLTLGSNGNLGVNGNVMVGGTDINVNTNNPGF
jgi:hypothetical protein